MENLSLSGFFFSFSFSFYLNNFCLNFYDKSVTKKFEYIYLRASLKSFTHFLDEMPKSGNK